MKVKVSESSGPVLDWMVAKCEGRDTRNNACVWFLPFEAESDDLLQFICMADDTEHAREQCENAYPDCTVDHVEHINRFSPSVEWSQGGPLIEQAGISLWNKTNSTTISSMYWNAKSERYVHSGFGPTPLIAAMRCYVTSKLGEFVDVPEELCGLEEAEGNSLTNRPRG